MSRTGEDKLSLRVTQASLNQTAMDFPRNMANIYEAIRIAVEEGGDILALEELGMTGYEANDDFQRTDNERILANLKDIADYANALDPNLIISVGHPWRYTHKNVMAQSGVQSERPKNALYNRLDLPFNVQTIISGGEIHGMTAKTNLFNDERGYEKRYFAEWRMSDANEEGGLYGTIFTPLEDEGKDIPFGRPLLHVTDGNGNAFNLAQAICEEKWVGTRYDSNLTGEHNYQWDNIIPSMGRELRSQEGLVVLIPDASPPAPDKIDKHEFLVGLASKHADVVINTDGLGSSGSTFAQFGHRLMAQDGDVVSSGTRAGFGRVVTTTTTVEINQAPDHTKKYVHGKIKRDFKDTDVAPAMDTNKPNWDRADNPDRVYEETIRMTALWLFDYMRKLGTKGIAEALSGGADSAFNCVMLASMVNLAMEELGVDGFCKEMGYLPYINKVRAVGKMSGREAAARECMKYMLTAVFMGTDNSSTGPGSTQDAARVLINGGVDQNGNQVEGIGGKYMERNVQDLLDFYGAIYAVEDTTQISPRRLDALRRDVAGYLNRKPGVVSKSQLDAEKQHIKQRFPEIEDMISAADPKDIIAYENIQARGRQVLIMMIANIEGKMAIANPNLDEARNAYATYGGDLHAGTINLNAHLSKAFQLEIMEYLYEKGIDGVMDPVEALGPILYEAPGVKRNPTAELQPRDKDGKVVQTDVVAMKGTFEQLNQIAEYMLYEKVVDRTGARRLNASEVFEKCQQDSLFNGLSENELYDMICFRYKRWGVAQHKIHASAIAPTYGRNVDHQTSLRTPNLSGNNREELALLGVKIIFNKAAADGLQWDADTQQAVERRALQDEDFVDLFHEMLGRSDNGDLEHDIDYLYRDIAANSWDGVFGALSDDHPITVLQKKDKPKSPLPPSLRLVSP